MPVPELPPGQLRVYWAMVNHRSSTGSWPTLQQIADEIGVSKTTVYQQLELMCKKGVVIHGKAMKSRCYTVPECHMPEPKNIVIPVIGRIKAENMR
ncbi:MAG: LexA family protein [Phycisphaerales bacterium JB065]